MIAAFMHPSAMLEYAAAALDAHGFGPDKEVSYPSSPVPCASGKFPLLFSLCFWPCFFVEIFVEFFVEFLVKIFRRQ
jgi:hypothetical protein